MELHLEVPPAVSSIALVRMLVTSFATAVVELDEARLSGLRLALTEACLLLISRAGPGTRLGVEAKPGEDALQVDVVELPGRERRARPTAPPPLDTLGSLVDRVRAESADGALRLLLDVSGRTLAPPPPGSPGAPRLGR